MELNSTTPESTNSADRFTAAQANSYNSLMCTPETPDSKMLTLAYILQYNYQIQNILL